MSYSFFPGSQSVNWNGSSPTAYNASGHRQDSNVDPYTRTSSSTHRTSSSRHGDRPGYSSYGDRSGYLSYGGNYSSGFRDYRSGSRDAVAGASRYEPERESRGDGHRYSSSSGYESPYSRFARERVEDDRRQSGYGRTATGELRRSSNYERDHRHEARRGATAGMYEQDRSGSIWRSGYEMEREPSSHRSRRDSESQAAAGARQGERSGGAAMSGYAGYRKSSAADRYPFSPDEYYKYW